MKNLLIAVLVISSLSVSLEAIAEQKIVFCGESSSYRMGYKGDSGDSDCNAACSELPACGLPSFLAEGWKIDANMTKSIIQERSAKHYFSGNCECNGTQYVLSKAEQKVDADKTSELLKKEMELLKKENDILKKENEGLKKESEALKQKNDSLKTKGKKNK